MYSYLNRFSTQKTLGNNDVQAIANPPVKKKENTKKKDLKHVDTTEGDEFKIDTQGHNYMNDFNETSSTRKKLPLYEPDSRNNFMLAAKVDIGNEKYVIRPKQKKKRTEKMDYEEKPELDPPEKEDEETEEEEDDDDDEEPEFDDDNMDDMIYEDAVKYDDRSFGTMLLRSIKQKLFFTGPFMSINVLEPFFVRLLTFFLLLALYYTLNGFFFHEAYISNRYGSKGNTGFTYFVKNELPRCLLAGLVGTVVSALIMIFAFSRRRFMTVIEEEKTHEGFMRRTQKMMRCLKIRLVIFVIVDILVMFFCWYYVSAFGAVYQQSQIPLLIGMAVTVVFVLIFQILYALIVCLMRYIGLKCKCICLYTVSTYLL